MPVTRTPAPFTPERFEVYSRIGNLLGSHLTEVEAERSLATAFNSKLVLAVSADGQRAVVIERMEMRGS